MMADERTVETRMLALLAIVNDWLKYAETKNSLVVGLASAGLLGSLTALPEDIAGSTHYGIAISLLVAGEAALAASVSISLISFLPKTDLAAWVAGRVGQTASDDNLYYFGHLAKYAPEQLAEKFGRRYATGERRDRPSEGAVDIAEQIVSNARITLWKLRLFVPALVAFVVGVFLLTLSALIGLT